MPITLFMIFMSFDVLFRHFKRFHCRAATPRFDAAAVYAPWWCHATLHYFSDAFEFQSALSPASFTAAWLIFSQTPFRLYATCRFATPICRRRWCPPSDFLLEAFDIALAVGITPGYADISISSRLLISILSHYFDTDWWWCRHVTPPPLSRRCHGQFYAATTIIEAITDLLFFIICRMLPPFRHDISFHFFCYGCWFTFFDEMFTFTFSYATIGAFIFLFSYYALFWCHAA